MLACRLSNPLCSAAIWARLTTVRQPNAIAAAFPLKIQAHTLTTSKPVDDLILSDHREIFALWRDFQSSLPASTSASRDQFYGTSHQDGTARHESAGASAATKPEDDTFKSKSPQASTLSYGGGAQMTTGEANTRSVDSEFGASKIMGGNKEMAEAQGEDGPSMKSVHERTKIANSLLRAIVIHSVAEEVVVYPELRAIRGDSAVDQLLAEQQQIENELYELDQMPVTHPDFIPRLTKIMHELELHAANEDKVEMPELRARLNDEWLISLGIRFQALKHMVPTRPHPSAPTQPTLEALVGMMVAPLDYLRDRLGRREFVEPSKEATNAEAKRRG